jgi:hypothetical protein
VRRGNFNLRLLLVEDFVKPASAIVLRRMAA